MPWGHDGNTCGMTNKCLWIHYWLDISQVKVYDNNLLETDKTKVGNSVINKILSMTKRFAADLFDIVTFKVKCIVK